MQLDGARAGFLAETVDDELRGRCARLDVHPSGPLWGAGEITAGGDVAAMEAEATAAFAPWKAGLAAAGLRQERRALRVRVSDLQARIAADTLEIGFELPAGAYATAVLRELVRTAC